MSKKLGLALGSGGSRGVAHVGLLCALEEEGIKPDYIAGCSIGAVVGGVYASGVPAEKLRETALKLKRRDLLSVNPSPLTSLSLFKSGKISKLLSENLATAKIEDFPIKFSCVATDVLSGKMHVFDSGDAELAIRASSCIPAVFNPVKLDGKLLVDGGCVCRLPIRTVKDMGADVVVAMDVLKNCSEPVEEVGGILSMVLRVFDIMDSRSTALSYERDGGVCDILLEPEMKGLSQYAVKHLEQAFGEGYMLAKKNMQRIKELLE